jgi:hypothetical protein
MVRNSRKFTDAELAAECRREVRCREREYPRLRGGITALRLSRIRMMEEIAAIFEAEALKKATVHTTQEHLNI